MIEVFDGLAIWDQIEPELGTGRRRAAVAYVGGGAKKYLGLKKDDVLVFDGHPSSVAQGHIDISEIRAMLRAGITLYSRAGLHSKMMVVESTPAVALVGSANASRTSSTKKSETAVLFDDPSAVQSVRDAIAALTVGLPPIDEMWADRMAPLVPKRRGTESTFRRIVKVEVPLARKNKPMWVWDYEWADASYCSARVNDAVARAASTRGVFVWPFALRGRNGSDYDKVRTGDSVVLVPWPPGAAAPRRNGRVDEPGLVIDKIPHRSGNGGDLLCAWRHNVNAVPWHQFESALRDSGIDDSLGRMPPKARRVIFELFASQATAS